VAQPVRGEPADLNAGRGDRSRSTEDAIAHGIKTTAGVTSAAIVMVGAFLVFAALPIV